MPTTPTLADKVKDLRATLDIVTKRRQEAATARKVAQIRLQQIDAQITELGFDPEMADAEIDRIEERLHVELDTAVTALQNEISDLEEVLTKAKDAGIL